MFIKQNKNLKEKFGVLQKKVLSFGPNRTVEVRLNSSAEPNVRSVTRLKGFPGKCGFLVPREPHYWKNRNNWGLI